MASVEKIEDSQRLEALKRYDLLDTQPESVFDRITNTVALIFEVPISLISLIDADRQFFKSCVGLETNQTSLDVSFCNHMRDEKVPMVITDATLDDRFKNNDLVTGPPYIRFYAGAPLITHDGFFLGSLCAISPEPRTRVNEDHIDCLMDMAITTMELIESRLSNKKLAQSNADLKEINEENKLFRQAIDATGTGVTVSDHTKPDNPLIYVNKAFEDMTGYSAQESVGHNCRFLQGPNTQQSQIDLIRGAIRNEENKEVEIYNYKKDGTPFWNSFSISPVYDDNGKLKSFIGIQNDVTKRKNRENDIRNILQYAPAAIGVLDKNQKLLYFNEHFQRLHNLNTHEMTGKHYKQLVPSEAYDRLKPHINKALNGKKSNFEYQIDPGPEDDGDNLNSPLIYSVNCNPRYDENGKISGIISFGHDITEIRRLSAQREDQQKLASLGQLAGGMAHEINNSLQPLIGLTEIVREKLVNLDQEAYEYMVIIEENAEHARKIVKDILSFARKEDVKLEVYEAAHIVDVVCDFVGELMPSSIVIHKRGFGDMAENEPANCPIAISKNGFMQIFNNILNNASHSMKSKGDIYVTLEIITNLQNDKLNVTPAQMVTQTGDVDQKYVCISIEDQGDGMDAQTQKRLFDPFFTTKTQGEGTGLGMSVVYGILKQWGGFLDVESAPEKGTTIKIYIPVHDTNDNENNIN